MKYIKLFEEYKDFVGHGSYNKVTEIDKDWVLKTPKKHKELGRFAKDAFVDDKDLLDHFKYQIKTMKENPDIFPKVKMLSKNKAAVERCDTQKAKEWYSHLFDKLCKEFVITFRYLLDELCRCTNNSRKILEYIKENLLSDPICKQFYDLIMNIKNKLNNVDIHLGNIGIDQDGRLKLIDF